MSDKPTLLFVSTRFLFPVDSGGKIRTTQVLRGLTGGKFRVVLVSPASASLVAEHGEDLARVCDRFEWWPEPARGPLFELTRLRHLPDPLPVPVRTDCHPGAVEKIATLLAEQPAVAVYDFAHAAVLADFPLPVPSVMFTHNVEAEIFRRHRDVATNPIKKAIWANQYRKMQRFERDSLRRFDVVVAVADRDSEQFARDYGVGGSHIIPTGVDLDFFSYHAPERDHEIVFCGSMDWMANQTGIEYYMNEIWPLIAAEEPDTKMTVVGRSPPERMLNAASQKGLNWTFTGFVDDVRDYMSGAAVSVIPLTVGGGTRLKAYEAMSAGNPIVSTSIGIEGLPVVPEQHYLNADTPNEFAAAVVRLIRDRGLRVRIAQAARQHVEENFSYTVAAESFEQACERAIGRFETHQVA
ncbi:MAG: glycosyltransferase family 4 protein [Pseudomonadota bacterium]